LLSVAGALESTKNTCLKLNGRSTSQTA